MPGERELAMSPERLVERCALEFERYVAKLHSEVGHVRASIPIAPYEMEYTRSGIPNLIRMARTAFAARAAFALEGPAWAQPLPLGARVPPSPVRPGPCMFWGAMPFRWN
jgi:hypothetical protein